jgi:hypothetical protein
MSERGVFAVDRGIWDHDVLSENEPFSRREAWLWIVSEAAWKPHKRRIIGRTIELSRGQYAGSLRFIASKWRWNEARVRRFLSALISSEMIDAKTDAGVTVLTVCKYDEYQRVSLPDDAMRETDVAAVPTQGRRKVEDMEDKERTEANASGAEAPADPAIPEREYFLRGREVLGNKSGAMIANLLKAKGKNVALARAALEEASQKQSPMEYVAAICRGPPVSAKPLTEFQRKQAETNDVRAQLREFAARGRGSGAPDRLLSVDHGERCEGVRVGDGQGVVLLPRTSDIASG